VRKAIVSRHQFDSNRIDRSALARIAGAASAHQVSIMPFWKQIAC
jgi:hypothetical protein